MSFEYFKNSTPAIAINVNDNFKHIGQGDIIPTVNTLLSYINDSCKLGNTLSNWNGLYSQYLQTTTSENFLYLKSQIILTATSSKIEISGFNDNEIIQIWGNVKFSESQIQKCTVTFNDDSTSNYFSILWNPLSAVNNSTGIDIGFFMTISVQTNLMVQSTIFNKHELFDTTVSSYSVFTKCAGEFNKNSMGSIALITNHTGFGTYYNKNSLTSIEILPVGTITAEFAIGTELRIYVTDKQG